MQEDINIEEYTTGIDQNKGWKAKLERFLEGKYFVWVVIVLVAIASFCFGRISKIQSEREPVRVTNSSSNSNNSPSVPLLQQEREAGQKTTDQSAAVIKSATPSVQQNSQQVIGSKNGTKYHLPTCPGAKQI